jgi:hypothetical protein
MSGKIGNAVFVAGKGGQTYIRVCVTPRNPQTAAQRASRNRLTDANRAFKTLNADEYAQWRKYAQDIDADVNPSCLLSAPNVHNVYVGLALKLLQINPSATLPRTPPTFRFMGDGIKVSATGGVGKVMFTATGSNTPEVLTELLLQRVTFAFATPMLQHYRHQAFYPFPDNPLSYDVTILKGYYATAIRFVHAPTGQVSALAQLGVVTVT